MNIPPGWRPDMTEEEMKEVYLEYGYNEDQAAAMARIIIRDLAGEAPPWTLG